MPRTLPTVLSVNLNKIALLRNSREGNSPNVLSFAQQSVKSGAQGITVHPRPDQRHIRPSDVYDLSEWLRDQPDIEFNIEGNPFALSQGSYPSFMDLVEQVQPHQATLVPDSHDQLTSDHGFDLHQDAERLIPIIERLTSQGIRISLFMDPDIEQIRFAKSLGVERIELYTGPYAAAYPTDKRNESLEQYQQAALLAQTMGLTVNAGHDLNLENLPEFLNIAPIAEVSIGHALTIDALRMGYKNAVLAYSKICRLD